MWYPYWHACLTITLAVRLKNIRRIGTWLKVAWIMRHPPSPEALWFDSGLGAADWGQEGKRPSQQHHESSYEESDGEQRHRHECDLLMGEERVGGWVKEPSINKWCPNYTSHFTHTHTSCHIYSFRSQCRRCKDTSDWRKLVTSERDNFQQSQDFVLEYFMKLAKEWRTEVSFGWEFCDRLADFFVLYTTYHWISLDAGVFFCFLRKLKCTRGEHRHSTQKVLAG